MNDIDDRHCRGPAPAAIADLTAMAHAQGEQER